MGEDVAALGEFGLIRRLVERLPEGAGVVLGPGDDAALVEVAGGTRLLATADLLVEGVHFDLAFSRPEDVGFKALTVNVSDVAAMGGTPRFALVSLGAGPAEPVERLEALYDGLAEAARAHGVAVVGGDTVRSERLVVSVAVLGEPPPRGPVTRAGARPGDVLCVTGTLGAAAAGLALLRAGEDPRARDLAERWPGLLEAHRRARARVAEGRAAAEAGARAMIDVSDGLLGDAGHLCEASGVGVVLDPASIPRAPGVDEVVAWLGGAPLGLPSGGGDDYELLIAVPPDRVEELARASAPTPLTQIGRFTEELGLRAEDGTPLEPHGWDHFAEDR